MRARYVVQWRKKGAPEWEEHHPSFRWLWEARKELRDCRAVCRNLRWRLVARQERRIA